MSFPPVPGSGPPSGAAGGDLSGNYPDPNVAKIQGFPVSGTDPISGQILVDVAGTWTPEDAGYIANSLGLGKYVAVGQAGAPTWIAPQAADWADVVANGFAWIQFLFDSGGHNVNIIAGNGNEDSFAVLSATPGYAEVFLTDGVGFIDMYSNAGVQTAIDITPSAGQVLPILDLGRPSSGALPTQQFVTTTAAQVSPVYDVEVHTPVTFNATGIAAATCKIEISPDNSTYSTLCTVTKPIGVTSAGSIEDLVVEVPAGWYLKLTTTNAVLGLSTYY